MLDLKYEISVLVKKAEVLVELLDFEPLVLAEIMNQLEPLLYDLVQQASDSPEIIPFIIEQTETLDIVQQRVAQSKATTGKELTELSSFQKASKTYNENFNSGA